MLLIDCKLFYFGSITFIYNVTFVTFINNLIKLQLLCP